MSGFRRFGRKPLRCSLEFFHSSSGHVQTETVDISETGMFVRDAHLATCLSIDDSFSGRFRYDQEPAEQTTLKVVRITEEGVGLVFE